MKDDEEEENSKGVVVGCDICEEPLSIGDSAYACTVFRFFLHKSCSQLPKAIKFLFSYEHPLTIRILKTSDAYFSIFKTCCQKITKRFAYCFHKSILAKFVPCNNCFSYYKEVSLIKFEHEGHPQDTLTLRLRPASFRCDACNAKDEGLFYQCDSCDFWIHKTCASLAPTIDIPHHHHEHPLLLMYSLPENLYIFSYANFATNTFDGMNGCIIVQNCRYFAHIECASNAQKQLSTPRDDPSNFDASEGVSRLLHFPMSHAFTDPLELQHSENLAQKMTMKYLSLTIGIIVIIH